MTLSKDDILNSPDLPRESVDVPEWGGAVWIRTMTGTERDQYEAETIESNGSDVRFNRKNARSRLLVKALCDEHGKRLFSDKDAEALGGKSCAVLDRLFEISQRLNGLRNSDVEALSKNSDAGQSAGSGSDSPPPCL